MAYGGSRLHLHERQSEAHAQPASAVLAAIVGCGFATIGRCGPDPRGLLAGGSGAFRHPDDCRRPGTCVPAHEARNAILSAGVPWYDPRICESPACRPDSDPEI